MWNKSRPEFQEKALQISFEIFNKLIAAGKTERAAKQLVKKTLLVYDFKTFMKKQTSVSQVVNMNINAYYC